MPHTDLLGLEVLLNWQTVVFSLGIFVLTYLVRTSIQALWKAWRGSHFYTDFVLHVLPILLGGAFAVFVKDFPWPTMIAGSWSARLFYGLFLGMSCGLIYGRVRSFLAVKGIKTPNGKSVVPEPPAKPKD